MSDPLVVGRRQENVGVVVFNHLGEPFGKHFQSYSDEAQTPLVIAQIEHIRVWKILNSILEVKEMDGILVGPI